MPNKKVCIAGSGKMGRQIGLCAAIAGYDVALYDAMPQVLDATRAWMEEYLAGRIAKGRMTPEQVAAVKARVSIEPDLAAACAGAFLVIEAIFENTEIKREFFRRLNPYITDDTIVATNASAILSSNFKDDVRNPARLCNMHFYNPALVLKFVEIVQGPHTSEETGRMAYDFCVSIGKLPILQKKELTGYAGNYILGKVNDRALTFYQDGYGTYQEADIIQEHLLQRKMGTFRVKDLSGIDTAYMVATNRYKATGKKPLQLDVYAILTAVGRLGRKSGHGYYDYEEPFIVKPFRDRSAADPGAKKIASVLTVGGDNARRIADELRAAGADAAFAPWTGDAAALPKADFILEDIGGTVADKRAFWAAVCAAVPEDTILASNDYGIMSSQVADAVTCPGRFMSAHFSPVGDGTVAEIVMNEATDGEAAGAVYDLCLAAKKNPVWQQREIPGFGYHSRDMMDALTLAVRFLADGGYCTEEDVDVCMENGIGFTKGYSKLAKMEF